MNHYVGIHVTLEASSLCVVDGNGKIIREATVASEPENLVSWLRSLNLNLTRIALEAGPLSQWLYAALRQAGFAVELLETRRVRNALKIMPVKTDRNDARGIAELLRLGWFRSVHCKTVEAQEQRALLTTRKLMQKNFRTSNRACAAFCAASASRSGRPRRHALPDASRNWSPGMPNSKPSLRAC
jgi:transposase